MSPRSAGFCRQGPEAALRDRLLPTPTSVPSAGSQEAAVAPYAASGWRCRPDPGTWKPEAAARPEGAGPGRRTPSVTRPQAPPPLPLPPGRRGPRGCPRGEQPRCWRGPGPPGNMGVLRAGPCPGLTPDTVQLLKTRGLRTGDRVCAPPSWARGGGRPLCPGTPARGAIPLPPVPHTILERLGEVGVGPPRPQEPLMCARHHPRPEAVMSGRPPETAIFQKRKAVSPFTDEK